MDILLTAYLVTALALWAWAVRLSGPRHLRPVRYFGWRERTALVAAGAVASLAWPVLAILYGAGLARIRLRAARRRPGVAAIQLAARYQRTSQPA